MEMFNMQNNDNFEIMEESILYDRTKYSRINRTDILMPRGNPSGKNMLLTVVCKDFATTLVRMQSGKTIKIPPSYRTFVRPYMNTKKVFNITKRIAIDRKEIRNFSVSNRLLWTQSMTSNTNAISDISFEMALFFDAAKTRPISTIISNFIPYLTSCIQSMPKTVSQKNILLIDAVDWLFTRATNVNDLKTNPVYLLYWILKHEPENLSEFDIDIILMGTGTSIIFNPSKMSSKEVKQFNNNLMIFMNMNINIIEKLERELKKEDDIKKDISPNISASAQRFGATISDAEVGDLDNPPKTIPTLKTIIDDMSDDKTEYEYDYDEDDGKSSDNTDEDQSSNEHDNSKDDGDEIFVPFSDDDPFGYEANKPERPRKAKIRSKLIEPGSLKQQQLLEQQKKINVRSEKTIEEEEKIIPGNIEVPTTDHSESLHIHNEDMSKSRYENYRKTYMEHGFDSDMVKAFTSLNTKDNAFYITDIKITDNSDSMNYLELWEVTVMDQYGVKSTIKIDIPKIYDNKYFLLGGNLKTLENQNVPLPIIKTGPNRVIITTNYNKIFMERYDTKSITTVSRLAKMVSFDEENKYFVTGTNTVDNRSFDIPLAMSEVSKHITEFKSNKVHLYFNMKMNIMAKNNPDPTSSTVWIGKRSGEDVVIDKATGKTAQGETIIDIILQNVPDDFLAAYRSIKTNSVNMYARMKMNMKNVSCLYIICYWSGLNFVLEKSGAKYRWVPDDTGRSQAGANEIRVRFADGSLYYENDEFTELLLNPLLNLNTKEIDFNAMNQSETWEDILVDIYGSYRSLNVIKAFHEWMIDWITLEILQMYNLPENITELIIYGIRMLSNNQYTDEINDSLQRMRHAEVIPSMVYYRLASQYARYVSSGGKSKMTLPQDAIVKDLLALTTLEDTSVINPVLELSKDASISKRGYRGTNLSEAYTRSLRTYSHDSIGKIATTTATGPNVGVQKYLTHEPDIMNIRGIRENTKTVDDMSEANVMSSAEMLVPLALVHDDATRVGMSVKQSGHVVPSEVSYPSLLSNGADEAVRFRLSSEYVVNAEEDGKVVEYDESSGMMVVQYKPYDRTPGKYRAFKLSPDVVKNSGGGIYFDKQLTTHLKVGDTFKKGEPLAYHNKFFTYSKMNGLCYNIGPLVRVVLYATSEAYEDGGWVAEDVAEMMASSIVYKETAQLDRNSNISSIVKVGDHIRVDDKLISFSTGTKDDNLNKLLSMLDDDTTSSLQQGKKASHAGTIVDIVIYSQVDPEQCSPSVKKLLIDYRSKIQHIGKVLNKYDKSDGIVKAGYMNRRPETDVKDKYGKIKGVETDILIEFYVKHVYNLSIGDKIILYSANKNTISKVIPNDQRGWSEGNPDDPIQGAISPSPLSKRFLASVPTVLANTTCLMELKRKILKIWNE